MPKFSGDRNYQGHHTHTEGLSVEDRYEKDVVLTHWLSEMLQPQHLTGPYLYWADCAAWYASVIFVRKKRHRSESMISQKTGQWHKASSMWFLHDGEQLLVCVDSPLEKKLETNKSSISWCTWSFCAYMPEQVYFSTVTLSCKKIWNQEQIVITASWWQIRRPNPLVVIAALHQLHQLLWWAGPLTVRVRVSIWGPSSLIRAGRKTAVRHVYNGAAHSTEGCKKWSVWEGLSIIHSFSVRLNCVRHKWTCMQTTQTIWSPSPGWSLSSFSNSIESHFLCNILPQIDF